MLLCGLGWTHCEEPFSWSQNCKIVGWGLTALWRLQLFFRLRVILGTLVVNNNFRPFYWQVHILWEIIGRNMRNVSRDVEVPSKGTEIIYLIWQFYFWMYKGNWQVPSHCPFLRNVFPNAAERLHRWHLSPRTLTNAQREMPWPMKGNWGPVIPRIGDACRCFLG